MAVLSPPEMRSADFDAVLPLQDPRIGDFDSTVLSCVAGISQEDWRPLGMQYFLDVESVRLKDLKKKSLLSSEFEQGRIHERKLE
eukprot:scaffold2811_cov272-Pinguiococcus_pyrenoidosus.AAC.1